MKFSRWFSFPDACVVKPEDIGKVLPWIHLAPDEFEQAFLSRIKDILELTEGDLVSIDGKTICGSREGDFKRAVHIVDAWSKANQLILYRPAIKWQI
ncbi:hypothetical protein EZS27_022223 [termite gut metagenome]|uniref:Uncharacterized protein n=1 Tax=termite gut metagenome TaxID=433724 RepID=A0A5J4R5H6_9ZZZZ